MYLKEKFRNCLAPGKTWTLIDQTNLIVALTFQPPKHDKSRLVCVLHVNPEWWNVRLASISSRLEFAFTAPRRTLVKFFRFGWGNSTCRFSEDFFTFQFWKNSLVPSPRSFYKIFAFYDVKDGFLINLKLKRSRNYV